MTDLDSILKSRDVTLPTKVHLVKVMVFPVVMYGCVGLWRKLSTEKVMLLNCGVWEDAWESLGLQGDQNQSILKEISREYSLSHGCWSWSSNPLATWCEELIHWKRPWFWERLKAGGKGDRRGWDGWMASATQRTWVWARSGSWWWTGKPGMLQSMGLQRIRHNWVTELNRTYKEPMNDDLYLQVQTNDQCWSIQPKEKHVSTNLPCQLQRACEHITPRPPWQLNCMWNFDLDMVPSCLVKL